MIDKNSIISEHLPYEIKMLEYAYERLQSPLHPLEGWALIECFCVHARNLIDFFGGIKSAAAREFTTSSYTPFDGVAFPPKKRLYGKLSTQIMHIGYDRTDDPVAKIGPKERDDLKALIGKEIANFRAHIKPQYRDRWERRGEKFLFTDRILPGPTGSTSISQTVGATGTIGPIDPRSP